MNFKNVGPIFLCYNTNIDNIVKVDKKFEHYPQIEPKLKEKIDNKEDFIASLLYCMKEGEGHEVIATKRFNDFLKKEMETSQKRIGGQTGIMSNFLSEMGIKCYVYTPWFSEVEKNVFHKDIKVFYDDEKEKNNWIFEFDKGAELFGISAQKNTRLILAERTHGYEFQPDFDKSILSNVDYGIFSGFQNMVKRKRKQISRAKKMINKFKVTHLEIVNSPTDIVQLVIKYLISPINSIGLDEVELMQWVKTLGNKSLSEEISNKSPLDVVKGLEFLYNNLDINKIYFHTFGYYICLTDEKKDFNKVLDFASTIATSKASGKPISESKNIEYSKKGIRAVRKINKYKADVDIYAVPIRMVKHPRHVVGLGDVISAAIFAGDLALQ